MASIATNGQCIPRHSNTIQCMAYTSKVKYFRTKTCELKEPDTSRPMDRQFHGTRLKRLLIELVRIS